MQTFGWLSADAARASCSKRWMRAGSRVRSRGQELQGDLAAEAQLGGEPHLAHASRTDEGDDFVGAEPCARL